MRGVNGLATMPSKFYYDSVLWNKSAKEIRIFTIKKGGSLNPPLAYLNKNLRPNTEYLIQNYTMEKIMYIAEAIAKPILMKVLGWISFGRNFVFINSNMGL